MLLKKFYLPIGILLVVICAVGLFSLRSDVPDEPIVIYKTTTPIKRSVTPIAEARTVSASIPIEETIEETPVFASETAVSTSEVSEFTRSELLERFPQYDFHSPESQENLRSILRNEKILEGLKVREAELARKIANQEAAKELLSDLNTTVDRLNTEYPDFVAFREKYPDPQEADFQREYPDIDERHAFYARVLEASEIHKEMADRILATPGMSENLSSESLELLHSILEIDERVGGLLE